MFSGQLLLWSPLGKVWIPMYALFQVKIGPWALENILKVVGFFNYFALHLKHLESFKPKYVLCQAWWKLSKWFRIFFNCDTCSIYFWYFTIISPWKNYCNTLKFHSPTNFLLVIAPVVWQNRFFIKLLFYQRMLCAKYKLT